MIKKFFASLFQKKELLHFDKNHAPLVQQNALFDQKAEETIFQIGCELLRLAKNHPEAKNIKERFTEWAIEDENFKVQLFRFIDTYPTIEHNDAFVYQVLDEYLNQPDVKIPITFRSLVKSGAIAKKTLNKNINSQIKTMGSRFIGGADAKDAAQVFQALRNEEVCFSADLLGEYCVSDKEAKEYRARYLDLIVSLSDLAQSWNGLDRLDSDHLGVIPRANISIKLSSLADKYTPLDFEGSVERCFDQLSPLLEEAKKRKVLINFDVETNELKELNIAVFKKCVETIDFPAGLAMQAYLKSGEADAKAIIKWAKQKKKIITVRLVKGAYWDYEVIHAQEKGWRIPVWTKKFQSDACFEKMTQLFIDAYPQSNKNGGVKLALGTHNLRSLASAFYLAEQKGLPKNAIEVQVLYGMAYSIKQAVLDQGYRLREYVPIGEIVPGMSYLVRRLLENTSNESWLLKGLDKNAIAEVVLKSPHSEKVEQEKDYQSNTHFRVPINDVQGQNQPYQNCEMHDFAEQSVREHFAKAIKETKVKKIAIEENTDNAEKALEKVYQGYPRWRDTDVKIRAEYLTKVADMMKADRDKLSAIMILEAGKTWQEADADVCEAIDFLNYYARFAVELCTPKRLTHFLGEAHLSWYEGRGVCVVNSPWNFPLAICTGLICAPLVMGNTVICKPAEQTPFIAKTLCDYFYKAGVKKDQLQFIAGKGAIVGAYLTESDKVSILAFTGSKDVGLQLWRKAGETKDNQRSLKKVICEMGGKNAMIIDNTADLDEAVLAARYSLFGFSGQKCSACSRLLVHAMIYDKFVERLVESCKSLKVGDPVDPAVDVGPVIDQNSYDKIQSYIELGTKEATLLLGEEPSVASAHGKPIVAPHLFAVDHPRHALMQEEIFGPVGCIFKVKDINEAIEIANDIDYKLTGSIFSRTPSHIELCKKAFKVGNLYINRGCTGAIVGQHPFGGFGLSGSGIKAGGEDYLIQFGDQRCYAENTLRRGFSPELTN